MRIEGFARVALFIGLVIAPIGGAGAQSLSALQAQVNKLAAAQKKMDSTLARLEARVAKLETAAEEEGKDEDLRGEQEKEEGAAEMDALEKRVAALERAEPAKGGGKGESAARTVRAPFVVENESGEVILRMTGGKSPRLIVGNAEEGHVELGTGNAGGGIVAVRDKSATLRAQMIASDGFGQFRAQSATHSATLTASDQALLSLFLGDVPSVRLRAGTGGHGSMILSDPKGTEMVGAGAIEVGGAAVGMVRTGPGRRPAGLVIPSEIRGVTPR
jgi:hypothetical protein